METKVADNQPVNIDRLRPRGRERNPKRPSSDSESNERKKQKEGHEEMEKLKTLVPMLRLRDGRVSQMDIIEETISYIDQLHRRIAERLVASTVELRDDIEEPESFSEREELAETRSESKKKPLVLTLEQVQTAERMSQDVDCSTAGGFAARLAELSKSEQGRAERELGDSEQGSSSETIKKTNFLSHQNKDDSESLVGEQDILKKDSKEEINVNIDKPTEDQKQAIEAVKASFVALLNYQGPAD